MSPVFVQARWFYQCGCITLTVYERGSSLEYVVSCIVFRISLTQHDCGMSESATCRCQFDYLVFLRTFLLVFLSGLLAVYATGVRWLRHLLRAISSDVLYCGELARLLCCPQGCSWSCRLFSSGEFAVATGSRIAHQQHGFLCVPFAVFTVDSSVQYRFLQVRSDWAALFAGGQFALMRLHSADIHVFSRYGSSSD